MMNRRYRKPLNKNGWMVKLQRLAFGNITPHFVGYCPFFWFTWLCLLILPAALLVRLIAFILSAVASLFEIPACPFRPPKKKLVEFYEDILEHGWKITCDSWGENYYKAVLAWIAATPDWEEQLKALYAERQVEKAKAEAR